MEDSRNLSSLCLSEPAPQEETLAPLHLLFPLICFCFHQGVQGTSSCGHKVGTDGLVINEFFTGWCWESTPLNPLFRKLSRRLLLWLVLSPWPLERGLPAERQSQETGGGSPHCKKKLSMIINYILKVSTLMEWCLWKFLAVGWFWQTWGELLLAGQVVGVPRCKNTCHKYLSIY